ncbi:hypothetical protein HRI_000919300 [Hibiscus trionum]|uniref:Uncharacterized protein n=1 Tax=Hibiscus trionum TaxID=183268 RepID=A0A9W7LRB2_HIBTR|nr:hypothetical protein HRI_000919300 [Hibiscus trionum]
MAAINPAVAAKLSVGVHRNPGTKSRKTMVAATNPSAKNGAALVLSTPAQPPLLHRNSVPRSLDTRIMAANPEVISPENLTGVPFFTECQFGNFSGQNLKLEDFMYWHGYGDLPETISQNQPTVEFKHFGDSEGSVGAVSYVAGDKVRWIIAWSNSGEDSLKLNKVYSEISEVTERRVDWSAIRDALEQSVSKYKAINVEFGFSADLWIDPTSNTPTMTAILNSD